MADVLDVLRQALARRDTRTLTYYMLALSGLMVSQMVYGISVDSLGLVSDAMHMAFHATAMGATVYGMLLSKRTPTFAFSYGFERFEVLAAFSNALMLVFVCLFILAGALHRLLEPRAFPATGIPLKLELGAIGLALNLWGIFALGGRGALEAERGQPQPAAVGGVSRAPPASAALRGGGLGMGMRAAVLHAYADAAASAAVMASVGLSAAGLASAATADTLQSFAVAGFTLHLAFPLLSSTGLILLSTRPPGMGSSLDRARREALAIDGVLDVMEEHSWLQAPGLAVGSVRVRARQDASESAITARVAALYSHAGLGNLTVQVEKDTTFGDLPWMGGAGASALPFSNPSSTAVEVEVCTHGGDRGHSHADHGHSHGGHSHH
jgi:cation diffusion facilitator family transporter